MELTIITTGGTIDKDYARCAETYNFEIGAPAVEDILKQVNPNFDYNIIKLLKKDSLDLTDEDRQLIYVTCCQAHCAGSRRILITHGTDTMTNNPKNFPDTARKLAEDKSLKDLEQIAIVLTGAGLPHKFRDSDAGVNIGTAIGALNVIERGIYVAMNGRVYSWNTCRKDAGGKFVEK